MSDDDHSIGSSFLDYYAHGDISSCSSEANNSIIYDSDNDPKYNIYENQYCIEYDVDNNFDVVVNHNIVSLHILSVSC